LYFNSLGDAKQFDMSTPISMIDNGSNKFVEITNKLNSLERVIAGVVSYSFF
jgi:hypothetical protein